MLEGGLQYQLRPGDSVIVFGQLLRCKHSAWIFGKGSGQGLPQGVEALRVALRKMSPDQLKANEITEEDRRVQINLYNNVSAQLGADR